eukprot:Awhi_evm1s2041
MSTFQQQQQQALQIQQQHMQERQRAIEAQKKIASQELSMQKQNTSYTPSPKPQQPQPQSLTAPALQQRKITSSPILQQAALREMPNQYRKLLEGKSIEDQISSLKKSPLVHSYIKVLQSIYEDLIDKEGVLGKEATLNLLSNTL